MLRSYLTTALRALRRRKGYALLNVSGLALGLAACLLIGLYVQDELSYDAFHEKAERTYRVLREFDLPDLQTTIEVTPSALAPALKEGVPAVETAVRTGRSSPVVQRGTQRFVEPDFLWADEGFFDVFSFPLTEGEAALGRPGTLVISETMARKYFAGETPVGQTLRVGERELEVTGVMADVPESSSLRFGLVGSLATLDVESNWGLNNYATYVLLREGTSKAEATPQVAEVVNATVEGTTRSDFIPHLQPLTGIHLGQGVPVEIASAGNPLYVWLFAALAVFIVLLACINFMNLATARSAERTGEVGMRKALGAGRGQLAAQFLGESVLMTLLALVLALGLARLALPFLNALAGKSLAFSTLYVGPQVLVVVGLALAVGLVAGSYPALVLSGFEPTRALRGARSGTGGKRLRQGLVVFQFAISIALLIGTAVVFQQLQFMRSAGLGFEEENVVVIERTDRLAGQTEAFKSEVVRLPGVERAATGYSVPGSFFINTMWQEPPADPDKEMHNMNYSFVGWGYVETLGIEMAAGRPFSQARGTDSTATVLNEAAARDFGWTPEEAIGKKITNGGPELTVIGVAEDFHYESLHAEVYPLALFAPLRAQQYTAVRVEPDDVAGTLGALRSTWRRFSDLPFEYAFLADDLAAQYRAEDRLAKVFGTFAGLAVLIACLGLFGLAAYTAQRRTKEIGVRKALGASVASIVALLSKDFLKLVALAFVVAVPVAYLGVRWWLTGFAYRVTPGVWTFLLAGALAALIAALTISYQSVKAARTNPTEALRYE